MYNTYKNSASCLVTLHYGSSSNSRELQNGGAFFIWNCTVTSADDRFWRSHLVGNKLDTLQSFYNVRTIIPPTKVIVQKEYITQSEWKHVRQLTRRLCDIFFNSKYFNIAVFILYDLSVLKNTCALIIFNLKNSPLLQRHLISSLMMCLLARGRDILSLTWHHSNSKPQALNDPINSWIPEPTFFSCSRSCFTQNKEDKTTSAFKT